MPFLLPLQTGLLSINRLTLEVAMNKQYFEADGAARVGRNLARACMKLGVPQGAAIELFKCLVLEVAFEDIATSGKFKLGTEQDKAAVNGLIDKYFETAFTQLNDLIDEQFSTRH
jgi:hypothetical protein